MTQNNHRDSNRMGLSAVEKNSREIDDLIEETERSIANTRIFLERMHCTETESHRYVEQIRDAFEGSLSSLKRRRDRASADAARQIEQPGQQPGY